MARKYIISIEGNIGAGKSTMLECLNGLVSSLSIVQEPVLEWQELQTEEKRGLLESFYNDQKTYGFQLQMYALLTRFQAAQDASRFNDVIVMERSIYSDRSVFADMLEKQGNLSRSEADILGRWSRYFCSQLPETIVVYLKTPIDVCYQRIQQRSRKGEEKITPAYLDQIEEQHRIMLAEHPGQIIELDGRQDPLELAQDLFEIMYNLEHD